MTFARSITWSRGASYIQFRVTSQVPSEGGPTKKDEHLLRKTEYPTGRLAVRIYMYTRNTRSLTVKQLILHVVSALIIKCLVQSFSGTQRLRLSAKDRSFHIGLQRIQGRVRSCLESMSDDSQSIFMAFTEDLPWTAQLTCPCQQGRRQFSQELHESMGI